MQLLADSRGMREVTVQRRCTMSGLPPGKGFSLIPFISSLNACSSRSEISVDIAAYGSTTVTCLSLQLTMSATLHLTYITI